MRGGEENLIPVRSTDEAKERGKKGGKASGAARRKKKSMREAASVLMNMDIQSDKTKQTLAKLGISEDDMNYSMAIMAAMMNEAAKGNVKAAAFIRDTMGDSAAHEMQKARLEIEKKRIELERRKIESQIKEDSGERMDKLLQNMETMYERIAKPVPNRDIEDFE